MILKETPIIDIATDPAPIDERFPRYKGIFANMGQNDINYPMALMGKEVVHNIDWYAVTKNEKIIAEINGPDKEIKTIKNYTRIEPRSQVEARRLMAHLEHNDMTADQIMMQEAVAELKDDAVYQEQKVNWPKNKAHFNYDDVFMKLLDERK